MSLFAISLLLAVFALAWPIWRALQNRRASATTSQRWVTWLARLFPPVLYAIGAAIALYLRRTFGGRLADPGMWLLSLSLFGFLILLPAGYLLLVWLDRHQRRHSLRRALLSIVLLLPIVFASWSLFIGPARFVERHYTITTPRAPQKPLTILHVSDLQTDGPCGRERLMHTAIARKNPDLVLFTGDLMNDPDIDDPTHVDNVIGSAKRFVAALHAPLGVYGVFGDWDGWGDDWPKQIDTILSGSKMKMLRSEGVFLRTPQGDAIALFGIDGGPRGTPKRPTIANAKGLRIVIVHQPDHAVELVESGSADLILAGHTHGGQIVLPGVGALVTHTQLGLAGGKHSVHGIPLIISRGIGMRGGSAPRIRFNCPAEISWIVVKRP